MKNLNSDQFAALARAGSEEELSELYGEANPLSLQKEIDYISDHYRAYIEKSPFVILATAGPEGLDCSPRGDPAGFVEIRDRHTVLLPDRRGNNRIDALRNIVRDDRASLLFLIPGINETLRINGRAGIIIDQDFCAEFTMQGKVPRSVIALAVERVYFQCPKALVRSRLWDPDSRISRSELPSTGKMIQALANDFDGEAYDRNYPEHLAKTIY